MSFPTFRQAKEAWFECYVCGFQFPLSEGQAHYKFKKLVDMKCADEPTHSDFLEAAELPVESTDRFTIQPVTREVVVYDAQEPESGAGGGGAGGGGSK